MVNKNTGKRIGIRRFPIDTDPGMKLQTIQLPAPRRDPGQPLLKALQQRKTTRELSGKKLPLQLLSDLLWAACGVNRKKGPFGMPGRTAASASDSQEIDVYVALEDVTFLYDALKHQLVSVFAGDLRPLTIGAGQSDSVENAPVGLVYVVDITKLSNTSGYQEPGLKDPEIQKSYYYVDTGMIAANVYLFAASRGLASWFHNCNKPALALKLNLRPGQRVLFGHTIGYPAKRA